MAGAVVTMGIIIESGCAIPETRNQSDMHPGGGK